MREPLVGPRVLALVADWTGCTLYRVLAPFAWLQARGYGAEWGPKDDARLADYVPQADAVILPRLSWEADEQARARLWVDYLHRAGKAVIYEVDDDLFTPHVIPQAVVVNQWGETAAELEAARLARISALQLCDGVTVSNPRLATIVRQYTAAPVVVVPNGLDLAWWRRVQQQGQRTVPGLTIGWAGGRRPDRDVAAMAAAWGRIAARYPDVRFVIQGHQPVPLVAAVPPDRLHALPWMPLETYPQGFLNIDIGCCPLADGPFNRAKTPIKAWEYAASGAAVVASPTVYRQTITPGSDGLLATTAAEWETALAGLIESPTHRWRLAAAQWVRVQRDHALAVTGPRWPAAWAQIVAAFRGRRGVA